LSSVYRTELLLALAIPARGQDLNDTEPSFFDPLVTLAPGISRELDLLFDHARAGMSGLP
jgi:hypothetical protein